MMEIKRVYRRLFRGTGGQDSSTNKLVECSVDLYCAVSSTYNLSAQAESHCFDFLSVFES